MIFFFFFTHWSSSYISEKIDPTSKIKHILSPVASLGCLAQSLLKYFQSSYWQKGFAGHQFRQALKLMFLLVCQHIQYWNVALLGPESLIETLYFDSEFHNTMDTLYPSSMGCYFPWSSTGYDQQESSLVRKGKFEGRGKLIYMLKRECSLVAFKLIYMFKISINLSSTYCFKGKDKLPFMLGHMLCFLILKQSVF